MKRSFKNPLIFIVTAVIIFTAAAVLFASAASVKIIGISVTVKDNTLDSSDKTSVYTLSNGKSTKLSYYNVLDRDNITLTVKYSDQSSKKYTGAALTSFEAQNGLTLRADDDQMTSPWSTGTHTVTYSLGGFTSSVKYTVAANEIASVSVSPMHPVEVIYHYSGEYKLLGSPSGADISEYFRYSLEDHDYNITLKYTNGKSISCSLADLYDKTGYTAEFSHAEKELSTGTQTGYCTVNGVKGSFSFKIVKSDIKSISLYYPDGTPTLYCPDDGVFLNDRAGNRYFSFFIDRSDLMAKVTYTSGSTADLTLGELISATHAKLNFDDQLDEPLKPGTIKLGAEIKGVKTSVTLNIQPADVTGVKATANNSTATVTWDPVPAEGYIVEYYSSKGWETLATITDGTYKKSWSGLVSGQTYYFGVRAFNTVNGKRAYTKRMQAHVTMPSAHPTEITGLKLAERGSSSLTLSWNVSANAGGYIVEQKIAGKWTRIARISGNKNSKYTVTGLSPATKYTFRVKSFNVYDGKSYYSEYKNTYYYTSAKAVAKVPLSSRKSTSLSLKWDKATGAEGYIIEQYKNGKWVRIARLAGNNKTSYTVTKLAAGTKYNFRIKTFFICPEKAVYSAYKNFYYTTLPAPVSSVSLVSRTSSSLSIKWDKVSCAEGYILEQYSAGKWVRIARISGNSNVKLNIGKLAPSTKYSFRIRTFKFANKTPLYSTYKNFYYYTQPAKVSGFAAARASSSKARLSWNKSTSAGGFIIEQYSGGKWVRIARLAKGTYTACNITELKSGTKYRFRIKAFNIAAGKSFYSDYSYADVMI